MAKKKLSRAQRYEQREARWGIGKKRRAAASAGKSTRALRIAKSEARWGIGKKRRATASREVARRGGGSGGGKRQRRDSHGRFA